MEIIFTYELRNLFVWERRWVLLQRLRRRWLNQDYFIYDTVSWSSEQWEWETRLKKRKESKWNLNYELKVFECSCKIYIEVVVVVNFETWQFYLDTMTLFHLYPNIANIIGFLQIYKRGYEYYPNLPPLWSSWEKYGHVLRDCVLAKTLTLKLILLLSKRKIQKFFIITP